MSENELTLKILTPDGQVLEADHLIEVVVPLADGGTIGIRPKHAPLIAETVTGAVQLVREGETAEVQLMGGLLSIRANIVTILTAGDIEDQETDEAAPADPYQALTEALENEDDSQGDAA